MCSKAGLSGKASSKTAKEEFEVVSMSTGPQHRPKDTIILTIGTPKRDPLLLETSICEARRKQA